MLHSTNAGSKETAAKELTVIPMGPFSDSVVTTHTPVANFPRVFLNSLASTIDSFFGEHERYHHCRMKNPSF